MHGNMVTQQYYIASCFLYVTFMPACGSVTQSQAQTCIANFLRAYAVSKSSCMLVLYFTYKFCHTAKANAKKVNSLL
jgi:hypothetical protein